MANKVLLGTYTNNFYKPGKKSKILLWYFVNVLFFKNTFNGMSILKVWFLRMFGARVGHGVIIKPAVNIKYPWLLSIGNNVWIGENVWIDNLAAVSIQDNVCISQGAFILCGNHNYSVSSFDLIVKDVYVEEGAWLGAKSVVCPGVRVGSHAVLSVGSIATKDLLPFGIYQGNPAIKIRDRVIK